MDIGRLHHYDSYGIIGNDLIYIPYKTQLMYLAYFIFFYLCTRHFDALPTYLRADFVE